MIPSAHEARETYGPQAGCSGDRRAKWSQDEASSEAGDQEGAPHARRARRASVQQGDRGHQQGPGRPVAVEPLKRCVFDIDKPTNLPVLSRPRVTPFSFRSDAASEIYLSLTPPVPLA